MIACWFRKTVGELGLANPGTICCDDHRGVTDSEQGGTSIKGKVLLHLHEVNHAFENWMHQCCKLPSGDGSLN